MRIWTKWGDELSQLDKDVIGAIARKSRAAAQIFVTGELWAGRLGELDDSLLFASNDMLCDKGGEPLFELTKQGTIHMTRFDSREVWSLWKDRDVDMLQELINKEASRFGVENLDVGEWDFYRCLVEHLDGPHGVLRMPIPHAPDLEAYYQAMYLAALLLFGKDGYMAVPVSRHFALPETGEYISKHVRYRFLTVPESDRCLELLGQYQDKRFLTNKELDFLADLFPFVPASKRKA
jgi:hypothetical protein